MRYDRYVTSLDGPPTHALPLEKVGPFGEIETRYCAKASQRSQSGPGAAAWLRARPVDASRSISAQEFLYAGRRHLGIEEHLATTWPTCGLTDANTQHARLWHRAGAQQVNQHQPLVYATSRSLKIRHQVESVRPFTPTGTYLWALLSRGEAFEPRRHRTFETKPYSSTSPTRTLKREFTCVPEVLTEMD